MENGDQNSFSIANSHEVNYDDVDWSMPGTSINYSINYHDYIQPNYTSDEINYLVNNITLNLQNISLLSSPSTSTTIRNPYRQFQLNPRSMLNNNGQLIRSDNQFEVNNQNPSSSTSFRRSTLNDNGQLSLFNIDQFAINDVPNPSFASYSSLSTISCQSTTNGHGQLTMPDLDSSDNVALLINGYSLYSHAVRDVIDSMVNDEELCRELQAELGKMITEKKKLIFATTRLKLLNYSFLSCANYFVQKLIEVVDQHELEDIVSIFTRSRYWLAEICYDGNGNKVMLKLVERLRYCNVGCQMGLMRGLSEIAVGLTMRPNCKQLVENCMDFFAPEAREAFLNEIANDCITIAKDKNGCVVLQKCFRRENPQSFSILVESVTQEALNLSKDICGNYIVQHVIELEAPFVADKIAAKLSGKFLELSKGRESSHVVEKLMNTDANVAQEIIYEMIQDQPGFVEVLQNEFGNFVGQTALWVAESKRLSVRNYLKTTIENYSLRLRNHPHGRNVLRALKNSQNPNRSIFNHKK